MLSTCWTTSLWSPSSWLMILLLRAVGMASWLPGGGGAQSQRRCLWVARAFLQCWHMSVVYTSGQTCFAQTGVHMACTCNCRSVAASLRCRSR
uniref:Uncharacterized protein n=1 Tax=Ixodes ricinus TaxID=34613 RepID=A0A6B0UHA0_IXORI